MSKLGKQPIPIPKDTKVKVESGKLILTGPKGSKELKKEDSKKKEIKKTPKKIVKSIFSKVKSLTSKKTK